MTKHTGCLQVAYERSNRIAEEIEEQQARKLQEHKVQNPRRSVAGWGGSEGAVDIGIDNTTIC